LTHLTEEIPMSTIVADRDVARTPAASAQRLRRTTTAVRVSLRWLGVRKTLTPEQTTQAAEPFHADGEFLSARKKLLDTRHPAYKDVTAVRGRILAYWKAVSLPYTEPGVRLIQQAKVGDFDEHLTALRGELHRAVDRLDGHYAELKEAARQRLRRLYNPDDYPPSLEGLFDVEWDFPSVEPPDYLMQLSPALYEQERARVAARFEEAVRLAEQAFVAEFARLVSHLTERLSGPGGERKVFRDSAVTNLGEFFQRFRELSVGSNEQLDELIERARRVVRGVEPQQLRDSESLRRHVATELGRVQATLDALVVDQPRRRILRSSTPGNGGTHAAGR
jgi:hypothetical protein